MKFSYNWLQSFFNKKLPNPKALADVLSLHSFEVESVEKKGKDYILDIDILPNRAHDCMSHIGVAREIGAVLGLKPRFLETKINENKSQKIKSNLEIEVKDTKSCLRYTTRMMIGITVKQSPKWIRERLISCGLKPINNVVDATNYVMLETGQPLHAFDFDKIESEKENKKMIVVRKAKFNEKITTLDNKTFFLNKDILVIADSFSPLAIAGIKGGKKAEIDKTTKNIVIESANFEMKAIRSARQKLRIITDASLRFEHQPDINLTEAAVDRVCQIIKETAGGEIVSGRVDYCQKKRKENIIRLRKALVPRLLGVDIPENKIISVLEKLELKVIKKDKKRLSVRIPTFRQDLEIENDLIEEVGRIYGLDKIPEKTPVGEILAPERNEFIFWENEVKDFLKSLGFSEIYTYSLMSGKEADYLGYDRKELLGLANPLSSEFEYLRPSLLPGLLKSARSNLKRFENVKVFEIGKVFVKAGNGAKTKVKKRDIYGLVKEKTMLAGVVAAKEGGDEVFYQLKGEIESLLNKLGMSDIWYDDYQERPDKEESLAIWNLNKSAEIKVGREKIGFLGKVGNLISKYLEVEDKLFMFEVDFDKLVKLSSSEQEYKPISSYPAAVRDLSLLVPREIKVVEILNRINNTGGRLVRDVDLFDIYEGEGVVNGKKSLSFHIVYQADDHTLTSQEIDEVQKKIIKELERGSGWEVRKM
ncbi:MAG TPA: phenylalanine--tRNA ligase subunit beta [Candidatus Parcubacteria bacterium]|nr:phenylalanine--tRNA ligase subunit beta [Candidatus Parcubacteria bacterium]